MASSPPAIPRPAPLTYHSASRPPYIRAPPHTHYARVPHHSSGASDGSARTPRREPRCARLHAHTAAHRTHRGQGLARPAWALLQPPATASTVLQPPPTASALHGRRAALEAVAQRAATRVATGQSGRAVVLGHMTTCLSRLASRRAAATRRPSHVRAVTRPSEFAAGPRPCGAGHARPLDAGRRRRWRAMIRVPVAAPTTQGTALQVFKGRRPAPLSKGRR
jgi:hypothetical protein